MSGTGSWNIFNHEHIVNYSTRKDTAGMVLLTVQDTLPTAQNPFVNTLLNVEEGAPAPKPDLVLGAQAVRDLGIRYVLVYPAATRPEAMRYALESLLLEPVDLTGKTQLYRIVPASH